MRAGGAPAARASRALVGWKCDRRKRRSGNPGDLRVRRISLTRAYSIVAAAQRRRGRLAITAGVRRGQHRFAGRRQLRHRHRRLRLRRHLRRLRVQHRIAEPVGEIAGAAAFASPAGSGWLSHSPLAGRAFDADVEVIVVAVHRPHLGQPGAVAAWPRGTAPS